MRRLNPCRSALAPCRCARPSESYQIFAVTIMLTILQKRLLSVLAHLVFVASIIPSALFFALYTAVIAREAPFLSEDVAFLIGGWWGFFALMWSWAKFKTLSIQSIPLWIWCGYIAGAVAVFWFWWEIGFYSRLSLDHANKVLLFGGGPLFALIVIMAKLAKTYRQRGE